jgi:hypothetical protein
VVYFPLQMVLQNDGAKREFGENPELYPQL